MDPDLVAAIVAEPRRMELRRVLADQLDEAGDVRGEFIQLQLVDRPSVRQRRRTRALLRHWGAAWSSGLGDSVQDHEFEAGFLVGGTVDRTRLQGRTAFQAELALLRRMRLVGTGDCAVWPHVSGLTEVVGLESKELVHMVGRPLRTLGFHGPPTAWTWPIPDALQTLRLEAHDSVTGARALLDRGKHIIELHVGRGRLAPWMALDRPVRLSIDIESWTLVLHQGSLEVWPLKTLSTERATRRLCAALEPAPMEGIRWVHIRGGGRPRDALLRRLMTAVRGRPLRLPPTWGPSSPS